MSDNKKNEMEYQYADESLGQESLQEPSRKGSVFAAFREQLSQRLPKSRKFRVLLFLAIAIYVVYTFLSVGGSKEVPYKHEHEATTTNQPPIAKAPQTAKVVQPRTTSITPSTSPTAESTSLSIEKPAATKDLNFYNTPSSTPGNANAGATSDNVNSAQLKDLQDKLNQLTNSTAEMQSALLSLTGSAVQLSNRIDALEKQGQKKEKKLETNPLPVFYLQSLIPGRAWVYSLSGDLVTVKVGDSLPGYGQVKKIDVRKGVIFTTSNRQIEYGPNDS